MTNGEGRVQATKRGLGSATPTTEYLRNQRVKNQNMTSDKQTKHISGFTSRILPLAVVLISVSWIFQLHIYLPPQDTRIPWLLYAVAFIFLLIRILSRSREPWTEKLPSPRWAAFLGFIACMFVLVLLPYPYNVGAAPLCIGWILLPFFRKHSLAGYFSAALVQLGILLLISASLLPPLFAWAARVHQLSGPGYFFTPAIYALFKLFGQPVDIIGSSIFLRTFEDLYPVTMTTEKLLPVPLVLFILIWSAVIIIRSEVRRVERLLFFWVIAALYAVIRLAVLLFIMMQRVNPSFFWDPVFMTISLIPLSLITTEPDDLVPFRRSMQDRHPAFPHNRIALLIGITLGSAAVIGLTFRDPGKTKTGRLLINEHGSDWEWTTEPMNTEVYNERTTYNYYCMAEFLKYYYDVGVNFEPLSPDVLKDVDVLILKVPTQPYQAAEIDAVVNFVKRGGGLWVIGDHTNVFGSSSFLNPLLRRFGYRLHYNSTHDLQTGKLSLYEKPPMFAHPSVVNLPPYLFATSCSMTAPWNADAAIIGYGLRTDHLDYSQKNFFPDRTRKQFDHGFGLFLQQAGGRYGKGRILIYTDSTTFSNFFIFVKGKPELVLGSLNWLNRSNLYHWVNPVALVIALLAFVLLFFGLGWNGAVLAGILVGVSLAGWLADYTTRAAYPLPQPARSVPWINFEREHSQYFLPTLRLSEEGDKSCLTFFVWTQRVGAVPREVYQLEEAVSGNDPVVMIDPAMPLDAEEMRQLRAYLNRGGRLLVIDSADNSSSVPGDLLGEFGLRLKTELSPSDTLHTLTLEGRYFPLRIRGKFSSISGGEPFLHSDQGDVIGATTEVGEGRIWALSCGHLFRNSGMGQTTVVPDSGLKALYEIEFDLVREMMGKSPAE